jgi:hypothetical protein
MMVVAAYWLLLLVFAVTGLRLVARGRRWGLLLFAAAGAAAVSTIYEPQLDESVLDRSTLHPAPPNVLLVRAEAPDGARIAAALGSAGFDLFVAPLEGSPSSGNHVADGATPVRLPGCRIEIRFEGAPVSSDALARTAQITVVREAGVACPFYGRDRVLPDSLKATRGLLPYVTYFGRAISTVLSVRLVALVPSPTRASLLQALGIAPPRRIPEGCVEPGPC